MVIDGGNGDGARVISSQDRQTNCGVDSEEDQQRRMRVGFGENGIRDHGYLGNKIVHEGE